MAAATGVLLRSVQRIWAAHGLQPHRVRRFKLSQDPAFAAKLHEVARLYLDPPAHSLVLSVDEKSQIQALYRTQPGLPMKKGRAGTMTHDYIRHGTTTLFAAMNILDGTVIGQNMQRHRHRELIRFLNAIERKVPIGKARSSTTFSTTTTPTSILPRAHGWRVIRARCSTAHRAPPPGSTPSRGYLQPSPRGGSNEGCSDPSRSSRMPFTASSMTSTQIQNPSPGPRTPTKSSPPSNAGTKC